MDALITFWNRVSYMIQNPNPGKSKTKTLGSAMLLMGYSNSGNGETPIRGIEMAKIEKMKGPGNPAKTG